ncbi:MAG: hypothetical protein K0R25_1233 [Rickettsiaceae bacterium]|jgi:redox-sensitive bicupin YhaK (pirin superfamily)|nr:hypothetical protein [Rickettsiaceae bacterium]
MIKTRKSADRGPTKTDWLDSKHTFSFGYYHDLEYMSFGALRVINEDKIAPGTGFGSHPHRDMEIITYVLDGALEHKDSLGTGSIIVPGDVQRMSAGTGIVHSEKNPLHDKPGHFLQIWIIPEKQGLNASYEQKNFTESRKTGKITLVASHDGRDGSLTIHQDVSMFVLDLDAKQQHFYLIKTGRMLWVQIARGSVTLGDQKLEQGDGAAISNEEAVKFDALEKSEILIFDLSSKIS